MNAMDGVVRDTSRVQLAGEVGTLNAVVDGRTGRCGRMERRDVAGRVVLEALQLVPSDLVTFACR